MLTDWLGVQNCVFRGLLKLKQSATETGKQTAKSHSWRIVSAAVPIVANDGIGYDDDDSSTLRIKKKEESNFTFSEKVLLKGLYLCTGVT